MKHVLIPTKLDSIARDLLTDAGFVVCQDTDTPFEELVSRHPETQALIVRSDRVTAEVLDRLPHLRLVVRAGSGYNTIDIRHARRKGIDVMNTPGANANGVAEEVFALALAYYRHVVAGDLSARQGLWEKRKFMGRELYGKVLGIVGLGCIGQLVAVRSRGFEMCLLGYDPIFSSARAADIGVALVDLETVFRESDIVTLHIPENDETRGLVNRSLLSVMKPGALLINCARAGVINEDDLRTVKAERDLGFCNDVYAADEAGPKSVADIADVMLPHLGANTREANFNAARRAAEQLIAYARQGMTKFVVNKGVPDELDEGYQELAYHVARIARHYLGVGLPVRHVQCSFYGGLGEFSKWFLPPICAALSSEFDPQQDPEEAEAYLSDRGIGLEIRTTDENKHHGNSMTIDLLEGDEELRRISVRGTLAEGNVVISRIDDFDRLYFVPRGHALVVVYEDRPGVLATITGACAEEGINIEDIRAPKDSSGRRACAVLSTNRPVPESVVERVRQALVPDAVFAISMD